MDVAVAPFERHRAILAKTLAACCSRRALAERGYENDVFLAGQLDVSSCVARFDGTAFVAA